MTKNLFTSGMLILIQNGSRQRQYPDILSGLTYSVYSLFFLQTEKAKRRKVVNHGNF